MVIRPIAAAEAGVWLELRSALWPAGSMADHRADIERFLAGDRREPSEVLVAWDGETAVGLAELSIRNIVDGCAPGRVGYLEGWYVVPAARRRGIGRMLVEAAERWARGQGCIEFGSDADIDNRASIAAHRALGFEETSRAVRFRKMLADIARR